MLIRKYKLSDKDFWKKNTSNIGIPIERQFHHPENPPQVAFFHDQSSDVGEMAIREAPRFPLGICHNNSSGKRHACEKPKHKNAVDGW